MRVVLPREPRWSPNFQDRLNGVIELSFNRLNDLALVPVGGSTGQVLAKKSNRDLDLEWATGGGGGGATDLTYDSATREIDSSTGTGVILPLFSGTIAGLVPLSGGGIVNYLRADGTFAKPPVFSVRAATWSSGTSTLTTDVNVVYVTIPRACVVRSVRLLTASVNGSCVVDIRRGTYAAFPTATSICASAKPTISSNNRYEDTTLTGWTTALAAGDVLAFVLESVSGFRTVIVQLVVEES